EIGEKLGYPLFMKPYDGGAWVGVTKIHNSQQLLRAYEQSGRRVMHLQRAVDPFDLFVRAIGIGPQVHIVRYDPDAPLHDRYKVDFFFVNGEEWNLLIDTCLTINAFFGWEFNSCESLRKDGVFHPIDFANACPDFQVTSLHFHFPDLVKNMVRWSLFCAATGRKKALNLDWKPFFDIAKKDLPYRERLAGYAKIARERFEQDRFVEWCDKHLPHLDEVAWEFFGTEVAKSYVRQKVAALFPPHEVHPFTEHFFGLIQFWRKCEADRMNAVKERKAAEAAAKAAKVAEAAEVVSAPEAPAAEVTFATPAVAEEVASAEVVVVAASVEVAPAAEAAASAEVAAPAAEAAASAEVASPAPPAAEPAAASAEVASAPASAPAKSPSPAKGKGKGRKGKG
ncbi:MAG TPA: hypothetical protein VIK91_25835, partial [Nannocystis sp.]